MRRAMAWRLGVLALAAPLLAGCSAVQQVDRVRAQFVALRYIAQARDLAGSHPLDRPGVKRCLDRAVALRPEDKEISARAVELYVAIEDYQSALAQLDEIGKRTGRTDPLLRGQCLLMTGKRDQGRALIYQAVQAAEAGHARHLISQEAFAIALNAAGYTLADAGLDLDDAGRMIETAVRLQPLSAEFADSLGWVLYREGDNKRAAFYLERAVRQMADKPDATVYYHLGMVYAAQGKGFWAERTLGQALAIDPFNAQASDALRRLKYELPQPGRV